ncbi:MAG: leucyl aminopeptidase [Solirubrobacterales bacterium]
MDLEVVAKPLAEIDVDLAAVGLADGDQLPAELAGAPGASDAKTAKGKLALLHPQRPSTALVVGLGDPSEVDRERLRVAAAKVAKRAGDHDASSVAWLIPSVTSLGAPDVAQAIVEGTMLGSYRFDRLRSAEPDDPPPPQISRLVLVAEGSDLAKIETRAHVGRVASEAANRVRDLQNTPSNMLTPERLAERAFEIASEHASVTADALDREAIAAAGLGGLVAVSQGSATEPRLISLRYSGGRGSHPVGLVGKAVTFDSGGISIKPSQGMPEMKMDLSGGAAVLEAIAAIAELGLACELVAAIPATENMPSGSAIKPGDVITQANGKTVEVNNTDAEGRLILADALTYCVRELGAERLVDLATLTGAVLIALGSTYAALISNDDEWAAEVARAAERSGELAWRLPLHEEYKQLIQGTIADLTNAASKRKAGTIYAASFLEEFVDSVPWAHLDIAGTAWDTGREYVGKGPTGVGVRLLVALAEDLSR